MSAYGVVICKKAEKQIKKLSKDDAKNVIFALTGLGDDPRPVGADKLSQNPRFWRIRVGDYRIIYAIESDEKNNCRCFGSASKGCISGHRKIEPSRCG